MKAIRKGYKNYRPVRAWDEDRLEVATPREKQYQQRQKDNARFFRERTTRDASSN